MVRGRSSASVTARRPSSWSARDPVSHPGADIATLLMAEARRETDITSSTKRLRSQLSFSRDKHRAADVISHFGKVVSREAFDLFGCAFDPWSDRLAPRLIQ